MKKSLMVWGLSVLFLGVILSFLFSQNRWLRLCNQEKLEMAKIQIQGMKQGLELIEFQIETIETERQLSELDRTEEVLDRLFDTFNRSPLFGSLPAVNVDEALKTNIDQGL